MNQRQGRVLRWRHEDAAYRVEAGGTVRPLSDEDYCAWANAGNGSMANFEARGASNLIVRDPSLPHAAALTAVPKGLYTITKNAGGHTVLRPGTLCPDSYVPMNGAVGEIVGGIKNFLGAKAAYESLGMAWHRGMLLYGPPGNGKTRAIVEAAGQFIGECCFFFVEDLYHAHNLRGVLSETPNICVFEEITETIKERGAKDVLNFLDGAASWPNTLCIATTNYPELLSANLVDRPSRFDAIIKVDNPTRNARASYLRKFLEEPGFFEVSDRLVDATEGMSTAYLKELIVGRVVYGRTEDEILSEFKARKAIVKRDFAESAGLGF